MLLLALALLTAGPTAPAAAAPSLDRVAAFERLKKLEGNWKSKEGQSVNFRVISGGNAVVESLTGADKTLASVTIYRVEGAELVATVDADTHRELKATSASATQLRFEGARAQLTMTMKDGDNLHVDAGGKALDYVREYVDTLK